MGSNSGLSVLFLAYLLCPTHVIQLLAALLAVSPSGPSGADCNGLHVGSSLVFEWRKANGENWHH